MHAKQFVTSTQQYTQAPRQRGHNTKDIQFQLLFYALTKKCQKLRNLANSICVCFKVSP